MAQRIIALFNLKPGVTPAEYEAWARSVDLPTVRGLKSIDSFTVFRSVGLLGAEGKPPYQYIEIIDVNDMNVFGQEVAGEVMQKVAGEFRKMVTDLAFIVTEQIG